MDDLFSDFERLAIVLIFILIVLFPPSGSKKAKPIKVKDLEAVAKKGTEITLSNIKKINDQLKDNAYKSGVIGGIVELNYISEKNLESIKNKYSDFNVIQENDYLIFNKKHERV